MRLLERLGTEAFPLFAAANHARSKTLDDAYRSCGFLIDADDRIVYEQTKAVRKALSGGAEAGSLVIARATISRQSVGSQPYLWDSE